MVNTNFKPIEQFYHRVNAEKSGKQKIFIITNKKTNRLVYVCDFIFSQTLKCAYQIEKSLPASIDINSPVIQYKNETDENGISIFPDGLLEENSVRSDKPQAQFKADNFYLFTNNSEIGFDIFSAVFYMISRYEEWQKFTPDKHGRFEINESILFQYKFHHKPVVDIWMQILRDEIEKKYPAFVFPQRKFQTIATIDVDNLYAYKHKGFLRTIGAGVKDMLKLNFVNIMRRNAVINDIDPDPFDIYDSFSSFCKSNNIPLIYFFLFSNNGKYDRTVNPKSKIFDTVFKRVLAHGANIGLHPGYYSKDSEEVFSAEKKSFDHRLGNSVEFTRQHYLKFDIRETPKLLLENGIKIDFSMGFASASGFRAGCTQPFYYYDFDKECQTELILFPFCAMDGVYFVYGKKSANQAKEELLKLKDEVKKVSGYFTTVFHERTFANHLYPGYGEMYKQVLIG
ncbi:MAG: polysaccharide deacetylase family protein [Sphingobacteriaceae bacterium]|nr:polysaccharide deacetylase family protein [Sphingobacteriaceae bacterium]